MLLLLTFRSLVVPIKAIILNLLSVGAAYGALVLVFQHGWFKSLLGFDTTGPIVAWLPLFLFVSCSDSRWITTCSSSPGCARRSTGE